MKFRMTDGLRNSAARTAARQAQPWLVWFGRFGFAAKGVVYTLIGVLAVRAAIGAGGQTSGSVGALQHVGQAPFGRYLLMAVGVGIIGYALWRFLQAILDTENKGTSGKGLAVRAAYFLIAVLHMALAMSAFALVSGRGAKDDSHQGWTAELMSQPFGRWLVACVGALVIAYGFFQMYRAHKVKFRDKLELEQMSPAEDKWATRLGRIGYAARGIVFAIIGAFLVVAALKADPKQARGVDGALDLLAGQPWGWAVLGAVASGLAAYGIFMFVEARYRRMVIT